ncbi:MAG: hypothetical protein AAGA75_04290 [Cyanobacteria bacterium P01_E01_bin.6]
MNTLCIVVLDPSAEEFQELKRSPKCDTNQHSLSLLKHHQLH